MSMCMELEFKYISYSILIYETVLVFEHDAFNIPVDVHKCKYINWQMLAVNLYKVDLEFFVCL